MSDTNQLTLNHEASCYSEQLTANLVGKCRTEELNGIKYLVAKIAALNPGVLNGSRGPLLYTPEDTRKATKSWNGVPLVVYHPTDDHGKPISANTDGVIHVGFTKNAKYGSKLTVEGWFDAEKTKTTDSRVYDALVNGTPMEVSTGLGTTNEEAPAGASYLGQLYSHIARDHRPDHLAILPDQRGACSINDGCGLHVNQQGEKMADQLCTNCGDDGECPKCKAKKLKKMQDRQHPVDEPVENEEEQIENCGGEGGKPGPCPGDDSDRSYGSLHHAKRQLEKQIFDSTKIHYQKLDGNGISVHKNREGFSVENGPRVDLSMAAADLHSRYRLTTNELSHDDLHQQVSDLLSRVTKVSTYKTVMNREFLKTLNCGGEGGKPGPCAGDGGTKSPSELGAHADALSEIPRTHRGLSGVQADKRAKAHEAAYEAHEAAAIAYYRAGDEAKGDYHGQKKKFHFQAATAHAIQGMRTDNQLRSDLRGLLKRVGTEFTNDKAGKSPATLVANSSDLTRGEPNMAGKLTGADRLKLVEGLTTNSGYEVADIWGEDDVEVLNAMSDEKLFKAALAKQTLIDQQTVVNQVSQITGERNVENMADAIQNAFKPFKKKTHTMPDGEEMEDEDMKDDEEAEGETTNSFRVPRQMTEAEFMKMAPPSIRADLEFSRAVQNKEKQELIGQITANVSGDDLDQAVNLYHTMPLPQLRIIANSHAKSTTIPEFDVNIRRSVNYGGMAVPTGNRPTINKRPGEGPKPVTINWAEISESNKG